MLAVGVQGQGPIGDLARGVFSDGTDGARLFEGHVRGVEIDGEYFDLGHVGDITQVHPDRVIAEIEADLGSAEGRATAIAAAKEACDGVLDGVVSCAALGPYDEPKAIARVNYFGAMAILDELRECLERGTKPAAVVRLVSRQGVPTR